MTDTAQWHTPKECLPEQFTEGFLLGYQAGLEFSNALYQQRTKTDKK